MLPQWLDLAFADRDRIETVVAEALAIQPNISANEFRRFIEACARAIQNIAAFLVANITFGARDDIAARARELAANTLAYHLADPTARERLIEVFGQSRKRSSNERMNRNASSSAALRCRHRQSASFKLGSRLISNCFVLQSRGSPPRSGYGSCSTAR